jgi:hypothetical protein
VFISFDCQKKAIRAAIAKEAGVKKPVENNGCLPEPKFKPAIGFHSLKYRPGGRVPAIR